MMSPNDPPDGGGDDESGYCRPPRPARYKKGQSGNLDGRPPGRRREAPYHAVLGRMATIRESGVERRVTQAEAFWMYLAKRGLEGDGPANRATLAMYETKRRGMHERHPTVITRTILSPASVTAALEPLRMARKRDAYRETARMVLEPWIVEAALARLGKMLSPAEQRIIAKATRTPHKVKWPDWWSERP